MQGVCVGFDLFIKARNIHHVWGCCSGGYNEFLSWANHIHDLLYAHIGVT